MTLHAPFIEEFGCTPEDGAVKLGNLRYDDFADFMRQLGRKLLADSIADEARGRTQLAEHLRTLSGQFETSAETADKVWRICAPYMEDT